MPLQHLTKAVRQPVCLGGEGALRCPNVADLKKRLAAIDRQRLDVILLVGPVHEIQAQAAYVCMEQKISNQMVAVAVYNILHDTGIDNAHTHCF